MSKSMRMIAIAVCAIGTAARGAPSAGAYVGPAMTKIKADHPEQVKPDRTITIRAARNEFESFQIALVGPLTGVTPVSRGFAKQQGSSPVLPSMRFFREDLVSVTRKSSIDTTMDVDPASGVAVTTRLPDPLVPGVDEVIGSARNAFGANLNVGTGEVRAIWVDVFVPPNTAPGNYTGTIDMIWTGGTGGTTITFTLEVWNFTLNSTASLKSTNGIHFWGLPHGHPNLMVNGQPDGARLAKLRARYGQLALDHRYSLGFNVDDGTPQDDLNHFDTFYGPAFKGTLGPGPSYDPASIGTQLFGAKLTALKVGGSPSAWSQYFNGNVDRLYFYTCNEPPKGTDSANQAFSAPDRCGPPVGTSGGGWSGIPQLAAPAQSPNHVRSLVTTNITFANANSVTSGIDIFSALINHMEVKSSDSDAIAKGLTAAEHQGDYTSWLSQSSVTGFPHELWTYQTCSSHACNKTGFYDPYYTGWPSYMIDADPVRARALEWLSFRYGAKGELYYEAVGNYTNSATGAANDPWADPWNPEFGGNGEGTLFYPGTPDRIGGASSVGGDIADIPIASLRLKMIREGMEDYEYMKMASDLANDGGSWAKGLVRNVFPHAYDTNEPAASGDADRRPKSERVMDYRSQIAQRIRELTPDGLVLTNIKSSSVTSTGAVISWTSDLKGDTQVKYGTQSGSYPSTTPLDSNRMTDHSATLSSLSPNRTYFYRVMTKSAQNVLTTSAESSFVTPNTTTSTPALVGSPSATGIATTQATISWNTNPEGDSTVNYGTVSGSYPLSTSDPNHTQTLGHSIVLSSLSGATQYYYQVQSKNAGGTMTSTEFTFTTATPSLPVISDVQASPSDTSASVTWTTDVESNTQVKYGTTSGSYPNQTPVDSSALLSHSASLSSLTPGTKYFYVVVSGNAGGTKTSAENSFTTHDSQNTNPSDRALVGTFTDGFTSFDPSKWTVTTATANDTADDYAGVLRLTPAAGISTARVYVDSLKTWKIIGSSVTVNALRVVDAGGNINCKFKFHAPGNAAFNQVIGFWYERGNLNAYYYVNGVQHAVATVAYSALNHAWWKMSESGGTIFWYTSADRVNWTQLGQVATSVLNFDLSAGVVGFDVAAYGTGNSSPGVAQFANLNVAPAPLSAFRDPFAFVDSKVWYVALDTPGSTVSASGGVLSLAPEPGNTSGGASVIGYATYALTGSSFSVKVPQSVSGPGVNQILRLAPGPFDFNRSLGFWLENGSLFAYVESGGNPTAIATLTYSPATHAYWRVREAAGTVYWDTSSDGVTWTNRGQALVSSLSFSPGSVSVYLTTKEFGTTPNASPGVGKFSNVNQ